MKRALPLGAPAPVFWTLAAGSTASREGAGRGTIDSPGVFRSRWSAASSIAHGEAAPIPQQRCIMCHAGPSMT
ncbi:MAG: hypothetical protein MUF52_10525 [Syntrophobacteraceae bacterium]|jgi:hypothetical protein|nr:hypothetical protein [Syntrophobacteraceae bacterium]